MANGKIEFDVSISTLSSPSQLTHAGFYNIASMSADINAHAGNFPMTDYAVGDFKCLLMYPNNQFGVFLVTSARNNGIIWKGTIWESKFARWDRIATEAYVDSKLAVTDTYNMAFNTFIRGNIELIRGNSQTIKNNIRHTSVYMFFDSEKNISGISLPLYIGSYSRGVVQMYMAFSVDQKVLARSYLDGNFYGDWD